MESHSNWLGWLAATSFFVLAGCGGGKAPTQPVPPEPPPATESGKATTPARSGQEDGTVTPIPLTQAMRDGVCELDSVRDVTFNSRYVRFLLKPKTGKQETIRIEPYWKLTAQKGKGTSVTVQSATVKLHAKNFTSCELFAAEIAHNSYGGVEWDWEWLAEDDPLRRLVAAAEGLEPAPSWNARQAAVWILHDTMDFKAMRKQRYSAPTYTPNVVILGQGGGDVLRDAGVLDEAFAILRAAGHAPEALRVYTECEAAYALALERYEKNEKALQQLYELGFFRTREPAFAILSGAWEKHAGEKERSFREAAFHGLRGMLVDYARTPRTVNAQAKAALEAALGMESDVKLKKEIEKALESAARAEKKK